jgi:hypothetical protein
MCPVRSTARETGVSFSKDTDLVVVFHVRQQYVTEMPLAEHNNMVKVLPSDRTDESLSKSVLPWGTWRRRSIANAH